MSRETRIIPKPLESVNGKRLRWAVLTKEKKHILAVFVLESAARTYAAGGGRVVEEILEAK